MSDVEAPDAAIAKIAREIVPSARVQSAATREQYSCMVVVDTDAEKHRINDDPELLNRMRQAAGEAGRVPDYLSAESQQSVDRRWSGNWNYVWR